VVGALGWTAKMAVSSLGCFDVPSMAFAFKLIREFKNF
jgi:hypothetical protein